MSKMKLRYQGAGYYVCNANALLFGVRFKTHFNTGLQILLTVSIFTVTFNWTRRYV